MGEAELQAVLAGNRPATQVDWDVIPMGRYVVFTLKTATDDPLYPLTSAQAKAMAKAIREGRAVDRLSRKDMQVGWRYLPPDANVFQSRGLVELHGAKTNSGLQIPTEKLPELAQVLVNAAIAARTFKAASQAESLST